MSKRLFKKSFAIFLNLIIIALIFMFTPNIYAKVNCTEGYSDLFDSIEFSNRHPIEQPVKVKITFNQEFANKNSVGGTFRVLVTNNKTPADDHYSNDINFENGKFVYEIETKDGPKSPYSTYTVKVMSGGFRVFGFVVNGQTLCSDGTLTTYDPLFEEAAKSCQIIMPQNIYYKDNIKITTQILPEKSIGYDLGIYELQKVKNFITRNIRTTDPLNLAVIPPGAIKQSVLDNTKERQTIDFGSEFLKSGVDYVALIRARRHYFQLGTPRIDEWAYVDCAVFNFKLSNNPTSDPTSSNSIVNSSPTSDGNISFPYSTSKSSGQFCDPQTGIAGPEGSGGILTAIGCIPTEPKALIQGILKFGFALAGGIALLLMILAAFNMIISGGNPEQVKEARDRFQSAVIGLVFIILSIILLQIIGVDILGIPGFLK